MFAETAQDLLVAFRQDVHDYGSYATARDDSDRLWKDDEILRYMTVACDALARATFGLREIASIGYNAGNATVDLPGHILDIVSARLVSNNSKMYSQNADSVGQTISNDYGIVHARADMFTSIGTPRQYVRDYDVGQLRLVPVPITADTLELSCYVTLAEALAADDDLPFLNAVDQQLILEHMKWQGYQKQDVETEDLVRAKTHKAIYDFDVTERKYEIQRQRRVPQPIQMEGW